MFCMETLARHVRAIVLYCIAAGALGCAGRDVVYSGTTPPPSLLPTLDFPKQSLELTGPLTLESALQIAVERHPELRAAAALAAEKQGRLTQAGLYPNPRVGFGADQVGSRGGAGGQQGPFIEQEIVTGRKLGLDQAAAQEEWSASQWQAVTRRYDLQATVRAAFYEVLAAQREVGETEALVKIASENVETSRSMERAGRANRPDVLRAIVELETNRNRLVVARKRIEAALPLLANAMGIPDTPLPSLHGDLEGSRPRYVLAELQDSLQNRSSEIMQARAEIVRAERMVERVRAENIPNVNVRVQPLYDFTQSVGQVSAELGVKLPLWNKNQGNILAAEAEVTRRTEDLNVLRIRLSNRLIVAFQRYEAAREQAERLEKEIIPQAMEALRLTVAGFRAGGADFNYTTLLDAQRTLAQSRLMYVQTIGDAWKSAAELEGLLQR